MNAGCYGGETGAVLVAAWGLDRNGERCVSRWPTLAISIAIARRRRHDLDRRVFQGGRGDPEALGQAIAAITQRRETTQPIREKTVARPSRIRRETRPGV